MASNDLVQARIDGAIKEEAAVVLEAIGLTVSDAVRLMLTRVARDKALPFEPLTPDSTAISRMRQARHSRTSANGSSRRTAVAVRPRQEVQKRAKVGTAARKNGGR